MPDDRDRKRVIFLENRIRAVYHNCKAQAGFLRADAAEANDVEMTVKHGEATAYEVVAGWLNAVEGC